MTTPEDPFAPPGQNPYAAPGPSGPATGGFAGPPPGAAPPPGYGQQPGYGPPPGYGQQPGWGAPQQTCGRAILALVLAIASFAVLPLIPAVVALVIATTAKHEIEASGGRLTGQGMVTAAKVLAWINVGLVSLVVVGFIGIIALATPG